MKSEVILKQPPVVRPEFKAGSLVILNTYKDFDKYYIVLIINGHSEQSNTFTGVVVHKSEDFEDFEIGEYGRMFLKSSFDVFQDKLVMEN